VNQRYRENHRTWNLVLGICSFVLGITAIFIVSDGIWYYITGTIWCILGVLYILKSLLNWIELNEESIIIRRLFILKRVQFASIKRVDETKKTVFYCTQSGNKCKNSFYT